MLLDFYQPLEVIAIGGFNQLVGVFQKAREVEIDAGSRKGSEAIDTPLKLAIFKVSIGLISDKYSESAMVRNIGLEILAMVGLNCLFF